MTDRQPRSLRRNSAVRLQELRGSPFERKCETTAARGRRQWHRCCCNAGQHHLRILRANISPHGKYRFADFFDVWLICTTCGCPQENHSPGRTLPTRSSPAALCSTVTVFVPPHDTVRERPQKSSWRCANCPGMASQPATGHRSAHWRRGSCACRMDSQVRRGVLGTHPARATGRGGPSHSGGCSHRQQPTTCDRIW